MVAAFYPPVLGLLLADPAVRTGASGHTVAILAGGLVIAALGMADDLKGVGPGPKLAGQVAAAALAWALGLRIDSIANPFGPDIALGALGLPFTALWLVGVINAVNFIDGIDGLAAGVGLIAISATFALSALHADAPTMLVAAALAGASLGFLVYNFSPASVFMGDTGSMFLGFVLAATAIPAHQRHGTSVGMIAPIVALGLPIGDAILAVVRRSLQGRPWFQADREHVHHLLLARGWSQRRTCLALYGVAAALAGAAAWLERTRDAWSAALVTGATFLGAAALLRWVLLAQLERVPEVRTMRRRNLELRASVGRLGEALHRSRTLDDLWHALRHFAPALDASGSSLRVTLWGPEGKRTVQFCEGCLDPGREPFRVRHGISSKRPAEACLEVWWNDGRACTGRDVEIAIERAGSFVAAALERVRTSEGPSGGRETGPAVAGWAPVAMGAERELGNGLRKGA